MTSAFARVCATTVLIAAITSGAGAAADVGTGRPPRFCATAETMRQEFRDAEVFLLRRMADVRAIERVVSTAAEDAPRSLRRSFATLLAFYDRILTSEIVVQGEDDETKDRYGDASRRAGRASLVIARYLRDRCGILL